MAVKMTKWISIKEDEVLNLARVTGVTNSIYQQTKETWNFKLAKSGA